MSGVFNMTNNDRYRLALRQGETLNRQFAISVECSGEVFDLEGYSARMQVRANSASDPVLSVTTEDGAAVDCTFGETESIVTSPGHNLAAGCPIVFTEINTTTGITTGTTYYVLNPTEDTFQVAAEFGGTDIALTDDGTGTYNTVGQSMTVDAAGGIIDVLVGANTTANLTPGMYLFDVLLIAADGIVTTIIGGKFEITPRITKQPVIIL